MTMINDLPMDLVQEILSRAPLKSMVKVRLTCKNWNNLSKSERFVKIHTGQRSKGEFQMITLMNGYDLCLVSVFVSDLSTKFLGKLTCLEEQVKISQVFQCDGLLLCILKEDDSKVVVWNPYLGQTRCIETRYFHRPYGRDRFSYALGYDDRSHKFLRFIHKFNSSAAKTFFWYEIYNFDSGLWTTLDVKPRWRIWHHWHGVSLKGNTYWLASQRNSENEVDTHIICFDFTSERFGQLLPLPFDAKFDDYVKLSCVREGKLAVLLRSSDENPYELIHIWIATKIEAENVTWSKFLTLNTELHFDKPLISNGNFFIDEEKKVAIGFYKNYGYLDQYTLSIIGEAGYFKRLDLGECSKKGCRADACSYVPSLVQIQESAGGKRKQQSDLEKRRYDENMSKLVALQKRGMI